jgi:hypothetical protein
LHVSGEKPKASAWVSVGLWRRPLLGGTAMRLQCQCTNPTATGW